MKIQLVNLLNKYKKTLYIILSTLLFVSVSGTLVSKILLSDKNSTSNKEVNKNSDSIFSNLKDDGVLETSKTYDNGTSKETDQTAEQKITLKEIPNKKTLTGINHVYQTFNNCGPASLSMALSFYGIDVPQQVLGQQLRPFQNTDGDNDDKSVTLYELADEAEEYGFTAYYRPIGNMELVKLFITYDMPVITRTWLKVDDDIGHYRVIKGFDENRKQIIQDDSLQGKNIKYSYDEFNAIWSKFNYEYLVLVPKDKIEIAQAILGDNVNPMTAWQAAVDLTLNQLKQNPEDVYARFNLSVAYYNVGEYEKSIEEFERVEDKLEFRTLWYQIEPILAYYEVGNYTKVFEITDKILSNHNRAFSELYVLRGDIYLDLGEEEKAKEEFRKAVLYNSKLDFEHKSLVT